MLLKNGNLIVGDGTVLESTDLRVEGELIAEVGRSLVPHGDELVLDLSGRWVLPGLIDAHTHVVMSGGDDPCAALSRSLPEVTIAAANNARRTLHAGFTTVRDMGACGYVDIAIRDAINRGELEGPRMLVAGACITMTGGHAWFLGGRQADGPDECRKAAREQLFRGVDHLKMMASGGVLTKEGEPGLPQLDCKEMMAIVAEAHKAGKKAAAHCHGLDGIRNAVRAGVDSVEHGSFADETVLREMAARGTFLCICMKATSVLASADGIPDYMMQRAKRILDAQLETCRRARRIGVKVAFGTDAGTPRNPHGENGEEFLFFVECGFSEMEAIQAATGWAAELLGVSDRVGLLRPKMLADVLVLRHNPLDDIRVLARPREEIELLLKGGTPVISRLDDSVVA